MLVVFLTVSIFLATAVFSLAKEDFGNGLAISITPPLIKMNVSPGQRWSSSIKVVNNNQQDLTVYGIARDFKSGEGGVVEFISQGGVEDKWKSFSLSDWIKLSDGPLSIPPFQSREMPFAVEVPNDASPGGHYAAILIGTRPPEEKIEGSSIKVASMVSSLILLNVEGEIIEKGWIKEFSTDKQFYDKPEVNFSIVFQNDGNTHFRPAGEIKIYNFFGKERGSIAINQKTQFGNVLPQSERKWRFEWKGEGGLFDAGRYRADVVLGFGGEAHQTVKSSLYFWVIPVVPAAGFFGGIILFFGLMFLFIRAYIRKAIRMAQGQSGSFQTQNQARKVFERKAMPERVRINSAVLRGPLKEAVVDLKGGGEKLETRAIERKKKIGFCRFVYLLFRKYYKFFLFLAIVVLWGGAAFFFVKDILKPEKKFEVIQRDINGNIQKEEVSDFITSTTTSKD